MIEFLANLASTNYRIFVTTICFVIEVLVLCVCIYQAIPVDVYLAGTMLAATCAMAGVDYLQFAKKRDTYQPGPPPDVEDSVPVPPAGKAEG